MAENVRGGLQSISSTQLEAATALALIVVLMVLSQALRAVVPAMVGQFIG
jgi:general L-amino acid transport system permease protein